MVRTKIIVPTDKDVVDYIEDTGTLFDDMQDVDHDGSNDWTLANGATLAVNSSNYVTGTKAIEIQGAENDNPGMTLSFTAEDWSGYKCLTFYACPSNTAGQAKALRVEIFEGAHYDQWDLTLSGADGTFYWWALEIEDSGKGTAPTTNSGAVDFTKVDGIKIYIQDATNTLNATVDDLRLWTAGCVTMDYSTYTIPCEYTFTSNKIDVSMYEKIAIVNIGSTDLTTAAATEYEVSAEAVNWVNGQVTLTSQDTAVSEVIDTTEDAIMWLRIVINNSAADKETNKGLIKLMCK